MLEKMPSFVGKVLEGVRPGLDACVARKAFAALPETIVLESPAFGHDGPLPVDATEDGRKLSPALAWRNVPSGTAELLLIVEDADSPTPEPLVHAIVLGLPGGDGGLAEGALPTEAGGERSTAHMGKNSFLKPAFLPADPPAGHGPHRYVFQLFALGRPLALEEEAPGRGAVIEAMRGTAFAKGVLIGTYERP